MLHLISYEHMRHNCQVYDEQYVGSLYLYGGPTSVTDTVRLIVLLLYSYTTYTICCFGDF